MNRLDLSHAPVALFHFNRTAEDLAGNGLDLAGTLNYVEFEPQHFGLAPGSNAQRPGYDAILDIDGPMTVEVTGYFYATPSGAIFASFTTTGESEATNTTWQLSAHNATQLRWIHERGASGQFDDILLSTNADCALPRPHSRFHAAAVRDSGGVVRLFLNGRQHGDPSPAFAAPTGGTSAFLRVMFGSTAFGLDGLKITASELAPAQVAASAEAVLGIAPLVLGTLWVGATTDTTATVVARMAGPVAALALDVSGTPTAPQATDADDVARFEITGLAPDTEYTIALPCGVSGKFRTHPAAAGTACDFTIAFSGDADTGATGPAFKAVRDADPLMFIHMGDMHYSNITSNAPVLFHAAFDNVFASATQHRLYRNVATAYVWDDHDYGGNNADGTSASKPAAAAVYRSRVPYYPLAHSTAIYQTWDVGRVRFIMTDQRSEASVNSATDNSSKTMLGATQKDWFKNLIANSPGMLIVWICPRWFGNANHVDSWNSFSTERAELVDYIKANAHGRVVVLSADQHYVGIDDGTNVDHATGGGEPLRTFQCAPLDRAVSSLGGTWTHGNSNNNGVFGTMAVEDDGTDIDVTWTAWSSAGSALHSLSFTVTP